MSLQNWHNNKNVFWKKIDWYSKVWFLPLYSRWHFSWLYLYNVTFFFFIGSGNKVLSGYPETGILKGGSEQEHPLPVMERSSPARLNLPLTQDESKTLPMHVFFSRQKSGTNLIQRFLDIDSTHISSKLECLRLKIYFMLAKINMLRWNLNSFS